MLDQMIFMKKQIFFSVCLYLVLFPVNCKSENLFTPYRIFFGLKQQVTNLYSTISLEERGFNQSEYNDFPDYSVYVNPERVPTGLTAICFKNRSDHSNYVFAGSGFDGNACRQKDGKVYGYDAYPEPPEFSFASLEFAPYYFLWRFGLNFSLINRKLHFTVVDYPEKNEEYVVILNSTSFSVPVFLNLGDKLLGKDGAFSMRLGLGPNFTYISQFDLESESLYERQVDAVSGLTLLFDITFLYTVLKLENTTYQVQMAHPKFKNDLIYINANDSYLGFFYYF